MGNAIVLHCKCGRSIEYDRSIDPAIPSNVVRIESDVCDVCDLGDFGGEKWFDAEGNEVAQTNKVEEAAGAYTSDGLVEEVYPFQIDYTELEEARADLFIGRRAEGLIHLERALGGDFVGRIVQS